MKRFTATLQREFARYGFTTCPLTKGQIATLYKNNVKLEEAYGVGCDVHCGFSFDEALRATS
jgi:hypothetical protein